MKHWILLFDLSLLSSPKHVKFALITLFTDTSEDIELVLMGDDAVEGERTRCIAPCFKFFPVGIPHVVPYSLKVYTP